jgi:glycerol-3-phosphate cytidylyltransferase
MNNDLRNKHALIIGGSNGIGLAIATILQEDGYSIDIADRIAPECIMLEEGHFHQVNLVNNELDFLDKCNDIDTLVITAGFGRVAPFESIIEAEIDNIFKVNTLSVLKVLHHFFPKMQGKKMFHCAVMGSISGHICSPLMATYAASKAAVCRFIESLNIELEAGGSPNRILDVSPGSIKGTRFNGGSNDLDVTLPLAREIIERMRLQQTLFIPKYDETFANVLSRYKEDPHSFGIDSYRYKMECGRLNLAPQVTIGYLSGTFDLFHIGHLNVIRRAKQHCDYLVVGVHKDGSHKGKEVFIPFEERVAIVKSIKYVDKVIQSEREDCDIYLKGIVKYDKLFVGSDYKGTERFNRYEQIFADKGVEIVYFPYTTGTSSTQLRAYLSK